MLYLESIQSLLPLGEDRANPSSHSTSHFQITSSTPPDATDSFWFPLDAYTQNS